MATASKVLSYEEWLALPENDEGREECVDGVVERMPAPKWSHALIVENVAAQLRQGLAHRQIRVVTSEFGLIIRKNPLTQRTPDIAVFQLASLAEQDGYIHSAPELAIEVLSRSNTPSRFRRKLQDYASIAVPEVWGINPGDRSITIHRLERGVYQTVELAHDGVTTLLRFSSVTVDFSSVWP